MSINLLSSEALNEAAQLQEKTVAMNEALILGSVRQHEMTEAAERLNVQLRAEILQRLQAEEALRESEERYRALFTCVPMAIFACDQNAVIQQYNALAVELWGREPDRGVERFLDTARLWLPDGKQLPQEESPIVGVLRTGVPVLSMELSTERADGTRVPVLANFAALKNASGKITGTIISFVDITERKKSERQWLRSQRMESIGTLAGGIAHDLNNSLAPIMMSLEVLRMKFPDPESQELLNIVDSSARRGADMVRQVLSFARGVEGRLVELQVAHLIHEVEKIVNETFLKHIQIRTVVPAGLWTVLGDSTQIHQVLLNLCLNARDAMPGGGELLISAENRQIDVAPAGLNEHFEAKLGPYVMVAVKDCGTGMTAETVDHIFDPFFTTKDVGKGSGLGLSTSLAIIKGHGGFVRVSSVFGKGTTFQIFIPARTQVVAAAAAAQSPEKTRGNGELILVVDDEAPMRQTTKLILETFGYRVVLACHGAEAVEIYKKLGKEIAVVLTDMTMPVMEGPEAIRILRTINARVPIIGMSGLATTVYAEKLASLGVKHVLPKPFTAVKLAGMVKQILEEFASFEAAKRGTISNP